MKRRLIQNLSVNAGQLVVNQILGLGIFYVLSTGLDKDSFGQISLSLAVLLAAFNILSFGIDQLTVKKIAAGTNPTNIISIYIYHILITGLAFYALLFAGYYFLPHNQGLYSLLLLIGAGKLMIFFSTPFKQAANGMERFRLLAWMSVISNIIRCFGLIVFAAIHWLSIQNIVLIFICGDVLELTVGVFLFKRATTIQILTRWDGKGYKQLLREALPQTGVVLITSALARFDWIFIGFMVSAIKLAEYSFAYKIFEISTLPLLAVAPLLIPRFTRLFKQPVAGYNELKLLVRAEMVIAALTALLLNICWVPVVDKITSGKYGLINVQTIFILSLCLPLLYLNNFLWTIYFAQGRMKMILTSFIITFLVNVVGDILLIPFFKNKGAAFAFLVACLVQTIYYLYKNNISELKLVWQPLALCTLCALLSGFAVEMLFTNTWLVLSSAVIFYILLLFITAQIKLSDFRALASRFSA